MNYQLFQKIVPVLTLACALIPVSSFAERPREWEQRDDQEITSALDRTVIRIDATRIFQFKHSFLIETILSFPGGTMASDPRFYSLNYTFGPVSDAFDGHRTTVGGESIEASSDVDYKYRILRDNKYDSLKGRCWVEARNAFTKDPIPETLLRFQFNQLYFVSSVSIIQNRTLRVDLVQVASGESLAFVCLKDEKSLSSFTISEVRHALGLEFTWLK